MHAGLIVAIFFGVTGCGSSLQVQSDYDRQADFSTYKTFRWIPQPQNAMDIGPLANDIQRAITSELLTKGLEEVATNPDLLIVYHAGVEEKVTGAHINNYGYGWGTWGYWGAGPTTSTVHYNSYEEGTLVIDMIDATENELVWRGVAQGSVDDRVEKIRKNLPGTIAKILEAYPPPPSS